jgi:tRNA(Ile)-lysidine synthase
MQDIVSNFIKKHSSPNAKCIIGVSGGADSMVLLAVLHKIGLPIIAVHYNFMLREKDADLDQALVEDYCQQNNIPCFVKKQNAQEYADKNKVGIQEAAREMRYAFFREVMAKEGATKIITAHHADDQVETVLFNLLRASGIKGLSGMPVAENDILRPLITVSKEEIYDYAKENNIPFREDTSNASDKYQRNFLRNNIIPQLEERFPNAKENILKSANHLSEATLIYEQRMTGIKKKLIEEVNESSFRVPIRKLKHVEPINTILYECFKGFGLQQNQLPELIKLIDAENGAKLELSDYRVYKDRNFLLIQSKKEAAHNDVFIESEKGHVQLKNGKLSWELIKEPVHSAKFDKNVATLDAKNMHLPFRVRKSREGDYFYPLGMKKKKKLSRYFIDNKFSPIDKENALVVEMDKKIIWLMSQRIDNRFRISDNTKSYYKFTFKPS